tara:strand:- start:604 stop:1134 length:531 start_codon:yes stop_codon:yes gene_type:complete
MEFNRKRINEGVERERTQQQDIIDIIKNKGKKEVQEVMATKQLDNLSYQKFRRTLGLFIKDLNYIIDSAEDVFNNPNYDNVKLFYSHIILLSTNWNTLVSSLTLMKYPSLEQKDKNKVYQDIKPLLGGLIQIKNISDNNANNIDATIKDDSDKVLNEIIEQIESNTFSIVSTPIRN